MYESRCRARDQATYEIKSSSLLWQRNRIVWLFLVSLSNFSANHAAAFASPESFSSLIQRGLADTPSVEVTLISLLKQGPSTRVNIISVHIEFVACSEAHRC